MYEANWDTTAVADGSHTINARATDSAANVSNDSVSVTVDNVVSSTMHVGDIDGFATVKNKKWQAFVTVLVHDDADSPLGNAAVNGTWSGSFVGAASGTTGSDGSVTFATGLIASGDSVTFPVDIGDRVATVCHMANLSIRLGRKLRWDPGKEVFIDAAPSNHRARHNHTLQWRVSGVGAFRGGAKRLNRCLPRAL